MLKIMLYFSVFMCVHVCVRAQARGDLRHSGRHRHRFAWYLVRRCRADYPHALPGGHPHGAALQVQMSDSSCMLEKVNRVLIRWFLCHLCLQEDLKASSAHWTGCPAAGRDHQAALQTNGTRKIKDELSCCERFIKWTPNGRVCALSSIRVQEEWEPCGQKLGWAGLIFYLTMWTSTSLSPSRSVELLVVSATQWVQTT